MTVAWLSPWAAGKPEWEDSHECDGACELLILVRVEALDDEVEQLNRHPGQRCKDCNLRGEHLIHIARLEVGFQQDDRHEVGDCSGQHDQHHLHVQVVNLRVDIEQLDDDERREGDGDDIHIAVVEDEDGEQDHHASLQEQAQMVRGR